MIMGGKRGRRNEVRTRTTFIVSAAAGIRRSAHHEEFDGGQSETGGEFRWEVYAVESVVGRRDAISVVDDEL